MKKPAVVNWFKGYAVLMLVIYVAVTGFGLFLFANPDVFIDPDAGLGSNSPSDTSQARLMGGIYAAIGAVLAIAFVIALLTPRSFWAWIYNLVLICLGLTSCCFWPITIPLLIFWLKAEVRNWYRNEPEPGINPW